MLEANHPTLCCNRWEAILAAVNTSVRKAYSISGILEEAKYSLTATRAVF